MKIGLDRRDFLEGMGISAAALAADRKSEKSETLPILPTLPKLTPSRTHGEGSGCDSAGKGGLGVGLGGRVPARGI